MTFHVGQKIVCVDDGPSKWSGMCGKSVKRGRIYTVLRMMDYHDGAGERLYLIEAAPSGCHDGFNPDRFRPIVEKKTDISLFTAMLKEKQREHSLCGND